jgi:dipeptidyl aminopeptidase/acylaminoacyl peptidase/predicted Ser/Thr protein kinase
MQLAKGDRLGPYEVEAPLGAGGMGEVYRARDTRLGREVAIKVLPAGHQTSREFRERFEREARAISALNHPNICTLFDVGSEGETSFLVMELIEGETLLQQLAGHEAAPLAETLRHATEIARALACAHNAGIVHRDLKPANVMITRSGVKLLDFGVAHLSVMESVAEDESTMVRELTTEGTIVGTLHYMAPEQLEGKRVDARTDIFAFGCILHEMLTRRRLFEGDSHAAEISLIMNWDPQRLELPSASFSRSLERLLRKCLARSPEDRWQSAADLAVELDWIAEDVRTPTEVASATVARKAGKVRRWLPWAVAAGSIALAIFAVTIVRPRAAPAALLRLSAPIVADRLQIGHGTRLIAISPDGRYLAYAAATEGKSMLWLSSLGDGRAAPIPHTEGGTDPFWSPDSNELGFRIGSKLVKVTRQGENLTMICARCGRSLATWGGDGTIVLPAEGQKLRRVAATGGSPVDLPIAKVPSGGLVLWPFFVDANTVAYCVIGTSGDIRLRALSLDSARDVDLGPIESRVEVVDGVLLFAREGALMAQRLGRDLSKVAEPVQIASDVNNYTTFGMAMFTASSDALAYVGSSTDAQATWFAADGRVLGKIGPVGAENPARLSPDGSKVVVSATDPHTGTDDLWVSDVSRNSTIRITDTEAGEYLPFWSPDGRTIAFTSDADGGVIATVPASGGEITPLLRQGDFAWGHDWAEGGLIIEKAKGLALLEPRQGAQPAAWMKSSFSVTWARLSPNRKYLAYVSHGSGQNETYVAPVDDFEQSIQVSSGGGEWPAWRHDSNELYFATRNNAVFAAHMKSTTRLDFEPARLLFRSAEGDWDGFDASPDGEKFLITRVLDGPATNPINIVANWKQLLAR